MDCVTIQNKIVLDILNKEGLYIADINRPKGFLRQAYLNMMEYYKYKTCPIFLAPIGYPGQMYGAKTNGSVLLRFQIPDNLLKIQKYYDWSDYIYFLECRNEFEDSFKKGYSFEQFEKDVLNCSKSLVKDEIYQLTIDILKKEWLIDIIPLTDDFIEKYVGQGGKYVLEI